MKSGTYLDAFLAALGRTAAASDVLGGNDVLDPPQTEFGYESTPANALVFAAMGVDGVHYAVLARDGEFDDASPVIQVAPMDFDEPVVVLADSFLDYLADGCGVARARIASLLEAATPEPDAELLGILGRFQSGPLLESPRVDRMNAKWLGLVVPREHDHT